MRSRLPRYTGEEIRRLGDEARQVLVEPTGFEPLAPCLQRVSVYASSIIQAHAASSAIRCPALPYDPGGDMPSRHGNPWRLGQRLVSVGSVGKMSPLETARELEALNGYLNVLTAEFVGCLQCPGHAFDIALSRGVGAEPTAWQHPIDGKVEIKVLDDIDHADATGDDDDAADLVDHSPAARWR